MSASPPWLTVSHGQAPLIVSLPHTGVQIPPEIEARLLSPWLARKDADWWIDHLYRFVREVDATVVHTAISRTVVDVNRDPSGVSLYPGQATTELCPTTTFDGEALYRPGAELNEAEIAGRRVGFFDPYHAALQTELQRLQRTHSHVVLYDCHSIRSWVPRLFDGVLPQFNIGTNSGASCDPVLRLAVERACDHAAMTWVSDGRFKGGYITRHYGAPDAGVHAIQMELACRGYMHEEPGPVTEDSWPSPYDPAFAAPLAQVLRNVIIAVLGFAQNRP